MKPFLCILSLALLLFGGCASDSVFQTDKSHPSLELDGNRVLYEGEVVSPYDVAEILEDHGISHETIIHIRVRQLDHLKEAQAFRHVLARAGYNRTALVTKEHADSWSNETKGGSRSPSASRPSRPPLRYRGADED